MKTIGIIMKIDPEAMKATVLTPEGDFISCKLDHSKYEVGEEILFQEVGASVSMHQGQRKSNSQVTKWIASAALFLVGMAGSWYYPTASIYFEVNPAFAIETNIYERVIGIKSYNADGEAMVSKLSLGGSDVAGALEKTIVGLREAGYLKEESSGMIIGYENDQQRATLEAELPKDMKALDPMGEQKPVVAIMPITPGVDALAKAEKSSPVRVQIALSTEETPTVEGLNVALNEMKDKKTKDLIIKAEKTKVKVVVPGTTPKIKKQDSTVPEVKKMEVLKDEVKKDAKPEKPLKPEKPVKADQGGTDDSNADGADDVDDQDESENVVDSPDPPEQPKVVVGQKQVIEPSQKDKLNKQIDGIENTLDRYESQLDKAYDRAEKNGNTKMMDKLTKIKNEIAKIKEQIAEIENGTMTPPQKLKRLQLLKERMKKIEALWVSLHVTG